LKKAGCCVEVFGVLLPNPDLFLVAMKEKEKAKIKEKLDKCMKESLLQVSDLLDLGVHKTGIKKVRCTST
jgi:hypothetical protein